MRKQLKLKVLREWYTQAGQTQWNFEDENGKQYYWRTSTHKIFIYGEIITCTAEIKGIDESHMFNVRSIKILKEESK